MPANPTILPLAPPPPKPGEPGTEILLSARCSGNDYPTGLNLRRAESSLRANETDAPGIPPGRIQVSRTWWTNFFRSPRQVGSIMPSSPRLARRVARQAAAFLPHGEPGRVIEVGAGTGAITDALAAAIPHRRLTLVEADPACCRLLRRRFPRAEIVEGLVEDLLPRLLGPCPRLVLVSSVPLFSLSRTQRDRVLGAFEALLVSARNSRVVQYTYVPWLPGPRARALCGQAVHAVPRNLPPAWVWSSTQETVP